MASAKLAIALVPRRAHTHKCALCRQAPPSRKSQHTVRPLPPPRRAQMVDMAHSYFTDYISGGNTELAEQLFDDDVVHKDLVWDSEHPVVG